MALCDAKGEFLFRVLPDVFPQGYLTETEQLLWGFFYEQKNNEMRQRRDNG